MTEASQALRHFAWPLRWRIGDGGAAVVSQLDRRVPGHWAATRQACGIIVAPELVTATIPNGCAG